MSPHSPEAEPEYCYGLHPLQELLRARRRRVFELFLDEKAPSARFRPLLKEAEAQQIRARFTHKQELFQLCGSKQHQGCVAVCDPYPYLSLDDQAFQAQRMVLLDNIEDPRNAGAILRSADIFGFHHIFLPLRGGASVYPSVLKTSAGAAEHLNIYKSANSNRYLQRAQAAGAWVAALDMKGDLDLREASPPPDRPLLLVIGGEDKRVGQYILNEADAVLRIPQQGHVNSLNASVAAGIAFHQFSATV